MELKNVFPIEEDESLGPQSFDGYLVKGNPKFFIDETICKPELLNNGKIWDFKRCIYSFLNHYSKMPNDQIWSFMYEPVTNEQFNTRNKDDVWTYCIPYNDKKSLFVNVSVLERLSKDECDHLFNLLVRLFRK